MSPTSVWPDLVRLIKPFAPAVRVKWSGDKEPTGWEPWIIVSSNSYLETGLLGPVPFREVEWVEVDPLVRRNANGRLVGAEDSEIRDSLLAALESAGFRYIVTDGKLRFAPPA